MRRALLVVCGLPLLAREARGQNAADRTVCDGRRVSAIEIDAGRPPFDGSARKWQAAARAMGLHHATTRPEVIRSYLQLAEGDTCTDAERQESERILRALPFLADATIRAIPDSAGGVRLLVSTVDEIPVLVAGAIRGATVRALTLGNANIGGLGLRTVIGAERGFAYRSGAHIQVIDYGAFERPLMASVDAARDPLGSHLDLGFSHPFYTDLQRGSWQMSFRRGDDYPGLVRPGQDDAALEVRQERWAIGGVLRTHIDGLVALVGGVALGNRLTPAAAPVIVSDSGLRPDPDTLLRGRYSTFRTTRLGALFGVRRVRYVSVNGFDGLFANQDVMTGVQVGALVAPGLGLRGYQDVLVASSIYAGIGYERSFIAAELESEASRELSGNSWGAMIASGRAAWYYKLRNTVTINLDDELSIGDRGPVPTQLAFSDPVGGVRGFGASRVAGGRRNVTRAELRWARPALIRRSDLGLALFADAGILRAGDVPYGTNATAQSVGVSLLAAYPTQSKRLYRLDFAIPATRNGGGRFEVRFSSGDPTTAFWTEPGDVSRSRLAPVPSSLFAWPTR